MGAQAMTKSKQDRQSEFERQLANKVPSVDAMTKILTNALHSKPIKKGEKK